VSIRRAVLVLVAGLLAAAPAAEARILVRYGFDGRRIETGPDTISVFEHARGSVRLSTAYRTSGLRSVEIRDVAGDGDFPELQGRFPVQREGTLHVHFAFLVTDTHEELNIALAGPACFHLGPDGIAFWLTTRDGVLAHVTNSITKKLAILRSFTWYRVDVVYDVGRGIYDLTVTEEQDDAPVVALKDQPGAASLPGSAVDRFSFIGDLRDASNVRYFVDDIVIGTDASVKRLPFEAPGRRRLFFEVFLEARAQMMGRISCLPIVDLADIGLPADAASAFVARHAERLTALLDVESMPDDTPDLDAEVPADDRPTLLALSYWGRGCRALARKRPEAALVQFERATKDIPGSTLYAVSVALALAATGRVDEANARWRRIEVAWRNDPRYPAAMALFGRAHGAWPEVERWLRAPAAEAAAGEGPPTPEQAEVAEQYFFALIWNDRLADAERYALATIDKLERAGKPAVAWIEHAGDVAFYRDEVDEAIARYERALALDPDRTSVLLKLSDVYFSRRDRERERFYREKVFGTLR
jgi:hypothetical protein